MGRPAEGGESPVTETDAHFVGQPPKYGEARETLSEAGSTTIQG
jgi:hypothetical protein